MRTTPYRDRAEAGDVLAEALSAYTGSADVVVLGLPRGGLPVAARVAQHLRAPLDALVVRKLGLPWQHELAMGAIAGIGGVIEVVHNESVLQRVHLRPEEFDRVLQHESAELRRREQRYRGDRPALSVRNRIVLVVDDGLATGSTMRAAAAALRRHAPHRVVLAAPIGAADTCADLSAEVDELVCPWQPPEFYAVGQGYRDFNQTSDDEVTSLLRGEESD